MGVCCIDLRKHTLPILDYCGRIPWSLAIVPEKIVVLSRESTITGRSGRPGVIKDVAVVESETVEDTGLITLFAKRGVQRAYSKAKRYGLRCGTGSSRDGNG